MLQKPSLTERSKAAGIHFVFSALLLCIALYLVFALWYPSPLHKAAGVTRLYLTLLAIDLILGPALTFIVFKKDKLKLRIDLAVILTLQISAFMYGLHAAAQGRPAWLAFVVDDFEVVRVVDIDQRRHRDFKPDYQKSLWVGPAWVAALYSGDPKIRESQRQDEIFNGISLAQRPETYAPLAVKAQKILEKAHPLPELQRYNPPAGVATALKPWPGAVKWLPLKCPAVDMVVLVNSQGEVLAIVDLRPW